MIRRAATIVALLAVAAPALAAEPKERAYTDQRTAVLPVAGGSVFAAALQCVDEMALRSEIGQITLIPIHLEDPVQLKLGSRTMMINAALAVSRRSQIFKVVVPANDELPADGNYFVLRGTIGQLDQAVSGKTRGGGISLFDKAGAGFANQRLTGVLTVSLFITHNDVVVPNTDTELQIALTSTTKGFDVSADIPLVGGSLSFETSHADGPHQAVKTLIDLAMIRAVGGLFSLPTERCLGGRESDPAGRIAAQKAFDKMKPPEQVAAIATRLTELGVFQGQPPTEPTPALREAIMTFQSSRLLPALGQVNADLYYQVNARQFGAAAAPGVARTPSSAVVIVPDGIAFSTVGKATVVAARQRYGFDVTTGSPAYVACFHTDGAGRTARIFPTARNPQDRIDVGQVLKLPRDNDGYSFVTPAGATEALTCLAALEPVVPRLPPALSGPPLSPVALGVHSAGEIVALGQSLGLAGFSSAVADYHAEPDAPKSPPAPAK